MTDNVIKGYLGIKGETGYSAYEIAVKNGFEGTEQDWLATLGTSSMFDQYKSTTTTTESTNSLPMPSEYIEASFVDIYVDGLHLVGSEYEITSENDSFVVNFLTPIEAGKTVEIVITMMTTYNLPISDTINELSTNDTASGSKSVYDFVLDQLVPVLEAIKFLGLDTDTYDATKIYNTGDIIVKNYKLYECQNDEVTGAWDPSHWTTIKLIVGDD